VSTVEENQTPPDAGGSPTSGIEDDAVLLSTVTGRSALLRKLAGSSPFIMGIVLVGIYVVFAIARPSAFPSIANDKNMLMDASTLLVMATAMTFVMVAGGIDLSIGSVLVFAGVCAAKVMNHMGPHSALTVIVGLFVAIGAGLAWGLFNGFCITRLRVPPLITTLGTLGAALGVADLMTNGNDISTIPPVLITVETSNLIGISWIVWVAVVVTLVGGVVLGVTRFGRHTYVVGSNAEAARRAGINVDRHLLKLYSFSGMAAGLAGMLSLTRFATTTIGGHSTDALSVITGVVLGGTSLFGGIGTVLGTLVGICIPTVLNNGLVVMNVQSFWQQVAIGFILIAAVYIDQLKRRQRDRA
jgi:ribose transport system permease protein